MVLVDQKPGGWVGSTYYRNELGGWDSYPSRWGRVGYRIDDATRLKLKQIDTRTRNDHRWVSVLALPILICILFPDAAKRWLAEFQLVPSAVSTFALFLAFAVISVLAHIAWQRQMSVLAEVSPPTVVLPQDEYRRKVNRQVYFGSPGVVVIAGVVLLGFAVWTALYERSPDRYFHVLTYLLLAWPSLRAWRWILTAPGNQTGEKHV
jgi:hypothetical protein